MACLTLALAQALDAGPRIEPPSAQCAAPTYPLTERASGIRGTVVVQVSLAADSTITKQAVTTSLSPPFDAAALRSLEGCQFRAAKVDGVDTPSLVELRVEFVPPVRPWLLEGDVVGDLGVALEGAAVSLGGQQTRSDVKGHFTLTFDAVPAGDAWVLVEKEGYALKGFPEVFRPGETTTVRYALVKQRGFETRIEGSRLLPPVPDADRTPQVSHFTLTRADIDRTPGALEDVSRVVMQLPGVAGDPDLLANFFVRGGSPAETIFYIDGIPLSNPYHLGGFASIFNPMMIEGAEFYAGGAPAKYEPALSGVLEVKYATADTSRPRVQADLSVETAKARIDTPLGIDGLSLVASFRRSYFELYFSVLKAFNLFGANVVAPDITEGLARLAYKRGIHQTVLTFIHASDGFNFVVKPGEEVLINFAGGLKLVNTTQILSLQHTVDLPGDSEARAQVAYTRDTNTFNVDSQKRFGNDAFRQELLARGDLVLAHSETNRTSLGLQYSWRQLSLTGQVTDARAVAPWAQQPIVDTGRANLDLSPALTSNLLAVYGEHTWRPTTRLSIEGGGRLQYDTANTVFSGSLRLGAAYTLPTLTTLKLSSGAVWQPVQSVLALDPTVGNPHLRPERALQLIVGLEQPLPFEALLRLEGWSKWMSSLVTNPDSQQGVDARLAAGLPMYTNGGFGNASGADGMLLGRTRHFSYSLGVGLVFTDRTNPLATGPQTYRVQWEQRFTASASLSWSPTSQWVFTSRANFRTGRPYTPVQGFVADDANQRWLPVFGETSSETYPFFFELNLRGERRFSVGPVACAVYLEVLNVTNTMNVFSYIYGSGDYAAQVAPTRGRFNHLPIRPFLGVRGEY
jgi:TonB family protein